MSDYVELSTCEISVAPSGELLYRQITDHHWDPVAKKPSSTAFGPATSDKGMPSFARSTKVSPQESRDWHQHNARSRSRGVWACTDEDVVRAGTRSVDDSNCPSHPQQPRSPGHCYVDYRHYTKRDVRIVRRVLLAAALDRGETPTSDCKVCSKLAELSPENMSELRDHVMEWMSVNGCKPNGESGDPIEQHYAETLEHMQNKWRDDIERSADNYEL